LAEYVTVEVIANLEPHLV